jgi:hypothetical protein
MSVSGISSGINAYGSQFQQVRKDFLALKADLASGDLTTSKEAYATLTQDLQNARQTQGIQGGNSQISTDLAAVGSALDSGDLATAQSAFATLTQDLQQSAQQTQGGWQAYRGHGHHHHHHGGKSDSTGTGLATDLAALGNALQSGDLDKAQSAFAKLIKDLGINGSQNTAGGSGSSAFSVSVSYVSIDISITV